MSTNANETVAAAAPENVENITESFKDVSISGEAAASAEGRRLFIGNLAYSTTEEQLREFLPGSPSNPPPYQSAHVLAMPLDMPLLILRLQRMSSVPSKNSAERTSWIERSAFNWPGRMVPVVGEVEEGEEVRVRMELPGMGSSRTKRAGGSTGAAAGAVEEDGGAE